MYFTTCLLFLSIGDPNKRDWLKGSTAVHYAASQGHTGILRLLIDAGGRYDTTNHEGKNCLDLATGDCVQLLRKQSWYK